MEVWTRFHPTNHRMWRNPLLVFSLKPQISTSTWIEIDFYRVALFFPIMFIFIIAAKKFTQTSSHMRVREGKLKEKRIHRTWPRRPVAGRILFELKIHFSGKQANQPTTVAAKGSQSSPFVVNNQFDWCNLENAFEHDRFKLFKVETLCAVNSTDSSYLYHFIKQQTVNNASTNSHAAT